MDKISKPISSGKPLKYGQSVVVVVAGAFFFVGVLMGMLTLNIIQNRMEEAADTRIPADFGQDKGSGDEQMADLNTQMCEYSDENVTMVFTVDQDWECESQSQSDIDSGTVEGTIPLLRITTDNTYVQVAFPFETACSDPVGCDEVEVYADDNIAITSFATTTLQENSSQVRGVFTSTMVPESIQVRVNIYDTDPSDIPNAVLDDFEDIFSDMEVMQP